MKTLKRFPIRVAIATLALAGLVLPAGSSHAATPPTDDVQSGSQTSISPTISIAKPPTDAEMRERSAKLLANQHRDDEALEMYERVERHIDRTSGANPRTLEDKSYRVVPTGAGNQKILLRDGNQRTNAAAYGEQMRALADVLRAMANPNDSRAKSALAKREKRQRERAQFVDAAQNAFIPKMLGTATCNGHPCDVFELDPNPDFHPHSMFLDALVHVTAKIWVDHETIQIVHGEAYVTSDISFGGGILGKLYRGGTVSMDQAEVAPGIWLPTRYTYDFSGRKFLFSFEQHQIIDLSRFRRVGPPQEALALVQSELSSGKTFSEDP
jgi:hypothetical protein